MKIEIYTSVDDMRSSIKCNFETYSVKDFETAIEEELDSQKRTTVIKLLMSGIRKKIKIAEK